MMANGVVKYASKRKRSETDEADGGAAVVLQSKMFINDKILAIGNAVKMSEIHKKTVSLLFEAARNPAIAPNSKVSSSASSAPATKCDMLTDQVILTGNGEIQLRDFTRKTTVMPLPLERAKAKCCNRETLMQVSCQNCSLAVCEFCGYSCTECGCFLCGNCVQLFDCGTVEQPICQNCSLFK